MNKTRRKVIEALEEDMMLAWKKRYEGAFGGLGNSLQIQGRCAYEADKRRILKKKRWDSECDAFVAKMKAEINR